MSKDAWILAHEELVAEYLEAHPEVSEAAAYELTASFVNERAADHYAAMLDSWRMAQEG